MPIANYGWIGVQLFFLISGFAIALTTHKSSGALNFLARRWTRLYPGMVVSTAIIFIIAMALPLRPNGEASIKSIVPGLTLVEPAIWRRIIGDFNPLEGSFWSLYVEAKMYALTALLIHFRLRQHSVNLWFSMACFALLLRIIIEPHIDCLGSLPTLISRICEAKHLAWFAAGWIAYEAAINNSNRLWLLSALTAAIAIFASDYDVESRIALLIPPVLFFAIMLSQTAQRIISIRWLIWIGLISYPLYLIHQNVSLSLIYFARTQCDVPSPLAMSATLAAIVVWSALSHWYIEKPTERHLRNSLIPRIVP